jgi:tRNA pseudouridine38-40 synthase
MRWLRMTLAYDGTRYAGWQIQPGQPTVQAALQEALARVTSQQTVHVFASGRTDAGVHALGQVVSLQIDSHLSCAVLVRALNATLPDDIAVLSVCEVAEGFHARRDALLKRYRYQIDNGPVADIFRRAYAWHLPRRLDDQAMQRAARGLLGTHDFRSFESSGSPRRSSVRSVTHIDVTRGTGQRMDQLRIEVEANGFLYNMVRTIVGTLVEVGRAAQPESWPTQVLHGHNRSLAGPTAPPHGLFLLSVDYNTERT